MVDHPAWVVAVVVLLAEDLLAEDLLLLDLLPRTIMVRHLLMVMAVAAEDPVAAVVALAPYTGHATPVLASSLL